MANHLSKRAVSELAEMLRAARMPPPSRRLDYRIFEEEAIATIGKIKISVDGKREQHQASHFHARFNSERSGTFSIETGEPFASSFSTQDDRVIKVWAVKYRKELETAWEAVRTGKVPVRIDAEL